MIERKRVHDYPVGIDRMPAHAMPCTGDRDAKSFRSGSCEQLTKLRLSGGWIRWNPPDFLDMRLIQPAGIIRKAGAPTARRPANRETTHLTKGTQV